jgi:hypothetical protein
MSRWSVVVLACAVVFSGRSSLPSDQPPQSPGSGRPAAPAPPGIYGYAGAVDGIWISRSTLSALPVMGPAWENVFSASQRPCASPNLNDQEDAANVCVMAKALVYARTAEPSLRLEVVGVLRLIASAERYHGRALALGRELAAYVIAADLIQLGELDPGLDAAFRARIRELLTTPTVDGPENLVACHEQRPNNWGAHCGASRAAVAAYLGDAAELARAADIFRAYVGEQQTHRGFVFGFDRSWQCDPFDPVGVNPRGCVRRGHSLDGVLPDDQRRGGSFQWPPPHENYVYEALQGALAQAVILQRAGYPSFQWGDSALLRAYDWLNTQARFPPKGDDAWETYVINYFYDTAYPPIEPARPGKNVGWTDWTHRR